MSAGARIASHPPRNSFDITEMNVGNLPESFKCIALQRPL
ncbi:hypothetical protein SELSPUOL_01470 [Selenomonas sputigena ATCC 35185]|uniref:Uncharacterized protein n=1 Tax=Selenomonas sputigena (strain ATCC 35185 / DSM 20758 / CCUG 44933 / VPI D19B-28) TaxID=546271 RepID=C9LVH6_SELS3|nr:hypothetical protein SELSPUOL_01470 [Selenomonas sputigena ATCC 35185]